MKTDLRVIKTKSAIENSFIELFEQKGFSNISIIEIAEKAMVNRNTIYLHYGTKEGILESIIASNFAKNFGNFGLEYFIGSHSNKKKIEELFSKLFDVLDENKKFYALVLRDSATTGVIEQEANKLRTIIYNSFATLQEDEIVFNFLITGIFGVISSYILENKGTRIDNVNLLTNFTVLILKNMKYSR